MTRRARAGTAILVTLLSAFALVAMQSQRRAEALTDSARARLFPSLVEAPELSRIALGRARAELVSASRMPLAPDVRALIAYASALEALQRGDVPRAERHARDAVRLAPTADAHVLLGTIARAALRAEDAKTSVAAALRIAPDHVRARLLDADLALDAGDGAHARARLEALIRREPEAYVLHARLGRALELEGDLVHAEQAYRAALAREGRDPATLINLARVLGLRGALSEADHTFERARLLAPNDARVWLGLCLVALTQRASSLEARCTRAADLDEGAAEPVVALGDGARARGDLEGAVAQYTRALARAPRHAGARTKLGHVLFSLGRLEEARAAYDRAIDVEPSLAAAHNGLGVVLGFAGEPDRARAALTLAAALDPRDPSPLLNLGALAERTGHVAEARHAFEAALERDPSSTAALERLLRL